jgi:hypothetical protein
MPSSSHHQMEISGHFEIMKMEQTQQNEQKRERDTNEQNINTRCSYLWVSLQLETNEQNDRRWVSLRLGV